MWDLGISQYTPSRQALLGFVRVYKWWAAQSIGSDTMLKLGPNSSLQN